MKLRFLSLLLLPIGIFAQSAVPVMQTAPVGRGVVLSVRSVTMTSPGVGGALIGGTAGGVIGHQFGRGNGNTAATVAGAIIGAVAGSAIEQDANRQNGYAIIVQTENGSTISVTQTGNEILSPGDKVFLIADANGATRVQRAPDDLVLNQPVTTPPPQVGQEVLLSEPPPPPPTEVIVTQPGPDYVWVGGYYGVRDHNRYWVPGRWERPPHRGYVWYAPRWEHRGRHYAYVPGYWNEGHGVTVIRSQYPRRPELIISNAPPAPYREFRDERSRPSRDYVWISGYWSVRSGRHVWVSGRWDLPPRRGAMWVEPRWEHRDRNYVFIEGFWR